MSAKVKKMIAFLLAIAAGVTFIVFGSLSLKEIREYTKTPAVVSHVASSFVPDGEGGETQEIKIYVNYTFDGKEYQDIELQNTKTSLREGDELTILVNPADPTKASNATKGMATIEIVAGSVVGLIGLGGLALTFIRRG